MLLGLAYNLIEKDLFGVAAFSLFFIAFLGLALVKRKNSQYKWISSQRLSRFLMQG